MWYMHTMKYYSKIKMDQLTTWLSLKIITLSKIHFTKKEFILYNSIFLKKKKRKVLQMQTNTCWERGKGKKRLQRDTGHFRE